jgi:hypothetical protein
MDSVLIIVGGFVVAVVFSEIALNGTKLQTGLARVILVHATVAALVLIYLLWTGRMLWVALIIFWSGAFLTWFGVRSHMESSILLRMLYLLRRGWMEQDHLLKEYEAHYGESQRLEELFRGELLEKTPSGVVVTEKGKFILRIVSFLK